MKKKVNQNLIAQNKKAFHDYHITDKYEAGIVLVGTEVKSIREHKINLRDSFAKIEKGEAWLYNVHISPYKQGSYNNVDPRRTRKLLLNKNEIKKLTGKVEEKGLTLIPISFYWKKNKVKVELGLAKAKKLYDKREDLKKKAEDREMKRAVFGRY